MTFKEAAKLILRRKGKPMTYRELTKEALNQKLISTIGETPERTMNAQIARDIKYKGVLSDFKRVAPGKFILNEQKDVLEIELKPDRISEELSSTEEVEVEGGYVGRAGEHAVLSELLFRGYNASLMAVDTGIDILATRNNEVFNIQVKTRNISRTHRAFFFNLRIASFERHNAGRTFYIFILRVKNKLDFLILPLHELERFIEQEFVHVVGNGKLYRITIRKRQGRIYIGRKENNVSYYLNRWGIIK